jgi:GR25 family glycosyltransferase involved in LPS biosynthesis
MIRKHKIVLSVIGFLVLVVISLFVSKKYTQNLMINQQIVIKEYHQKLEKYSVYLNTNINIPVYYINMDKSVNRRKVMERQFKILRIQPTRVPGIDGSKLIFNNKSISPAEKGCTMSHLKAIKMAYDNDDFISLITEDDTSLMLSPLWDEQLSEVIQRAPSDWQIINLAVTYPKKGIKDEFIRFDSSNTGWGAWGYVINRSGMKQLIDMTSDGTDISAEKGMYQVADMFLYKSLVSYEYYGKTLFYLMSHELNSTIDPDKTQSEVINRTYISLTEYGIP